MKQEMMGWQWHHLDAYQNHLHLGPDRQPRQHLITQFFFTGGMLFLTPNEQHRSIEGRVTRTNIKLISLLHGPKIMTDDYCTG